MLHVILVADIKHFVVGCERRLDVAVVVDKSGSMLDHYPIAMAAAENIVYGLNLKYTDTRLAYITYSNSARVHFNFDTYTNKTEAIEAITLDSVTGDTNVDETLEVLQDLFTDSARKNVRQIVLWLSDGKLEKGAAQTLNNAFKVKQDTGMEIYAIGTGGNLNRLHLNGIASDPSSHYRLDIPAPVYLEDVIDDLLDRICF